VAQLVVWSLEKTEINYKEAVVGPLKITKVTTLLKTLSPCPIAKI